MHEQEEKDKKLRELEERKQERTIRRRREQAIDGSGYGHFASFISPSDSWLPSIFWLN